MAYEIVRFPFDGTVDADGHVLEPATLWEDYLEARYRDRAIRIRTDEDGLEYLELDGRPSERTTKGVLGLLGAMGEENVRRGPERRYMTTRMPEARLGAIASGTPSRIGSSNASNPTSARPRAGSLPIQL